MASLKTLDKIDAALLQLDDFLVSPEVAAAMFGIKKRYFNRLVAADIFGLQNARFENEMLNGNWYYREDIERVSKVYKTQKKTRRANEDSFLEN